MRNFFKLIWRILTAPFRWVFGGFIWLLERTPFGDFLVEDPEDTPILETIHKATEEPKDFLMALLEHLNALRKHLFRAMIGLAIATVIAFIYIKDILAWLAEPVGGIDQLQAIEVTEPIGVVMRVTIMTGFAIALPYISFEILRFIAPGISRRARLIGLFPKPN